MYNNRQQGSHHVFILVIATLVLIGAVGFMFWNNILNKGQNSATAGIHTSTSKTKKSNASASISGSINTLTNGSPYLVLDEWGVKFKISDPSLLGTTIKVNPIINDQSGATEAGKVNLTTARMMTDKGCGKYIGVTLVNGSKIANPDANATGLYTQLNTTPINGQTFWVSLARDKTTTEGDVLAGCSDKTAVGKDWDALRIMLISSIEPLQKNDLSTPQTTATPTPTSTVAPKATTAPASIPNTGNDYGAGVIYTVNSALKTKYPSREVWLQSPYNQQNTYTFMTYRPTSTAKYYLMANRSASTLGTDYADKATFTKALSSIRDSLVNKGLKQDTSKTFFFSVATMYQYRNDNVLCAIDTNDSAYYIGLTCNNVTDFWGDTWNVASLLTDAYNASDASKTPRIQARYSSSKFDDSTVKLQFSDPSKTNPTVGPMSIAPAYKASTGKSGYWYYAGLLINGQRTYFYRKTNGAPYQYALVSSNWSLPANCSAFNTTDLKAIFKGVDCYDTSTKTTKKV